MTEQEKRNNVIRFLEEQKIFYCACSAINRSVEEFDYKYKEYEQMYSDAIALLKALEPRVMTLDEVCDTEIVWIETLQYDELFPALTVAVYDDNTAGFYWVDEDGEQYLDTWDYNIKWRCWNKKPTNEQREAVKWE